MNVIDYRTFKQLLHIEDDDCWLAAPGFQGQFNYRIAEGAVRAVPWGMKVDESSRVPIRPLIRDMNYCPTQLELLDGELRDLEPWNPSGIPDAVLFELPAPVTVVIGFLNQADLWWMVDKVL